MSSKQKTDEPRNMIIRRATAFDVVNLAKMLLKSKGEQSQKGWDPRVPEGPAGEFVAVRFLLALIDIGLVFVADLEGRLMGAIGNSVHQPPYSHEWVLLNEWFYVLPQFRESEIGDALIVAINTWADSEVESRNGRKKDQVGVIFRSFPELSGMSRQVLEDLEYEHDNGSFRRRPATLRAELVIEPPGDPPQSAAAA